MRMECVNKSRQSCRISVWLLCFAVSLFDRCDRMFDDMCKMCNCVYVCTRLTRGISIWLVFVFAVCLLHAHTEHSTIWLYSVHGWIPLLTLWSNYNTVHYYDLLIMDIVVMIREKCAPNATLIVEFLQFIITFWLAKQNRSDFSSHFSLLFYVKSSRNEAKIIFKRWGHSEGERGAEETDSKKN